MCVFLLILLVILQEKARGRHGGRTVTASGGGGSGCRRESALVDVSESQSFVVREKLEMSVV